jgi:hypothetical protein
MPKYVVPRLGDREHFILDHGFGEAQILPAWWNDSLAKAGLDQFQVSIDPNRSGSNRLTRRELFALAKNLNSEILSEDSGGAEDDDTWMESYLQFFWHVLAWGAGTSRRNNSQRIQAFVNIEDRRANARLLRKAAHEARDLRSTRDAYSCLIRGSAPPSGGV